MFIAIIFIICRLLAKNFAKVILHANKNVTTAVYRKAIYSFALNPSKRSKYEWSSHKMILKNTWAVYSKNQMLRKYLGSKINYIILRIILNFAPESVLNSLKQELRTVLLQWYN